MRGLSLGETVSEAAPRSPMKSVVMPSPLPGICFGLAICFLFLIHLLKDFSRHVKRGVRRGHTAIDGGLQQYFLDLIPGNAVVEGGFHMHAKFLSTIQRDHHRQGQQAASMAGKSWPRPYLAPGITSNKVLEVAVEFRCRGKGSINMRVA